MIIVYACNFLATFTGRWESWQRRKASPEACSYAEVAVRKSELLARRSRSKPAPALRPAQLMMRMRSCSGVAKCWSRAWKTWSSREAVMACCRRGSAPSAYHSQNISGRVGRNHSRQWGSLSEPESCWQANRMGGIGAKPERPATDGSGTQAEMEGRA